MVIVLDDQAAVTPAGRPIAAPMPVAPVVVWVMLVKTILIQSVGEDEAADTILSAVTIIVPVAEIVPQPPDSGML